MLFTRLLFVCLLAFGFRFSVFGFSDCWRLSVFPFSVFRWLPAATAGNCWQLAAQFAFQFQLQFIEKLPQCQHPATNGDVSKVFLTSSHPHAAHSEHSAHSTHTPYTLTDTTWKATLEKGKLWWANPGWILAKPTSCQTFKEPPGSGPATCLLLLGRSKLLLKLISK